MKKIVKVLLIIVIIFTSNTELYAVKSWVVNTNNNTEELKLKNQKHEKYSVLKQKQTKSPIKSINKIKENIDNKLKKAIIITILGLIIWIVGSVLNRMGILVFSLGGGVTIGILGFLGFLLFITGLLLLLIYAINTL